MGFSLGSLIYTIDQSRQLKEHAAAPHGEVMTIAIINHVTHVDKPARCVALHSSLDLCVREWRSRLKPVRHKAYSRDHGRAELLEAGFEDGAPDRGSRGVGCSVA